MLAGKRVAGGSLIADTMCKEQYMSAEVICALSYLQSLSLVVDILRIGAGVHVSNPGCWLPTEAVLFTLHAMCCCRAHSMVTWRYQQSIMSISQLGLLLVQPYDGSPCLGG